MNMATGSEYFRVWDLPVRLFHWLLAGSILLSFLSAKEDSALSDWHVPLGWVAASLIAFRVLWGFIGGEHARFANFVKPRQIAHHLAGMAKGKPAASVGHNALGGIAVIALLLTVGLVVATGAGIGSEEFHEGVANLLLGLIAFHVLAVITMSVLTRDNLLRAMITGRKSAARHPGARNARPPAAFAVPVAAAAVGLAGYGATLIDENAFTPGAHREAGEQEQHHADGAVDRD